MQAAIELLRPTAGYDRRIAETEKPTNATEERKDAMLY
jgi:hypothetical protein